MKSIARQCVWWTTITKGIERHAKPCTHCCKGKDHSRCDWTSWPPEGEKRSRVHIEFAGPFFDGCYILVLVDAYSRSTCDEIIGHNYATQTNIFTGRKIFQMLLLAIMDHNSLHTNFGIGTENWMQLTTHTIIPSTIKWFSKTFYT